MTCLLYNNHEYSCLDIGSLIAVTSFFYFQSDFNLEVFLGEASSFRVSCEIAVLCNIAGILRKLVNTKLVYKHNSYIS